MCDSFHEEEEQPMLRYFHSMSSLTSRAATHTTCHNTCTDMSGRGATMDGPAKRAEMRVSSAMLEKCAKLSTLRALRFIHHLIHFYLLSPSTRSSISSPPSTPSLSTSFLFAATSAASARLLSSSPCSSHC